MEVDIHDLEEARSATKRSPADVPYSCVGEESLGHLGVEVAEDCFAKAWSENGSEQGELNSLVDYASSDTRRSKHRDNTLCDFESENQRKDGAVPDEANIPTENALDTHGKDFIYADSSCDIGFEIIDGSGDTEPVDYVIDTTSVPLKSTFKNEQ